MTARRILVIRSDDRFSKTLRDAGHDVINLNLIRTVPADDLEKLDDSLGRLNVYDGLFFTSPLAATVFVDRVADRVAELPRCYALGERAKQVLEAAGIDTIFIESANTAEEMIRAFPADEFDGQTFLFIRGDRSVRTIPELLNGRADVDEVIVYETRSERPAEKLIDEVKRKFGRNEIHWTCFFSPSGVDAFEQIFDRTEVKHRRAATIGNTTAERARKAGFDVEFISRKANSDEFARGLIEHINGIE